MQQQLGSWDVYCYNSDRPEDVLRLGVRLRCKSKRSADRLLGSTVTVTFIILPSTGSTVPLLITFPLHTDCSGIPRAWWRHWPASALRCVGLTAPCTMACLRCGMHGIGWVLCPFLCCACHYDFTHTKGNILLLCCATMAFTAALTVALLLQPTPRWCCFNGRSSGCGAA